jgi:hypothetical protein
MVVHDLDILRPSLRPTEAKAKLIVNTDAMLTRAITFQSFQSISGRNSQVVEPGRDL